MPAGCTPSASASSIRCPFDAPEMQGREVIIDGAYVRERLESVLQNQDLSRDIL